jgi:hypothetical protein
VACYVLPRDVIRIHTSDPRVLAIAERLWEPGRCRAQAPLEFTIDVAAGDMTALDGPLSEHWSIGAEDVEFSLGQRMRGRIESARGRLTGWIEAALLDEHPSQVARLMLETPAAVMLARRSYGVVHAGAVAGPAGAVVIRGAPGAGKSTLVAAAHRAGLNVLGDETVLVARDDPDDLLAAVRDLTLLPDASRLLALDALVTPATTHRESKVRVDLFSSSRPANRSARRVATLLLGSRNSGPPRLEPLSEETFLEEFRRGEIPQERWSGTPETIAASWARRGAFRLTGTGHLAGAIDLLAELVASSDCATSPA